MTAPPPARAVTTHRSVPPLKPVGKTQGDSSTRDAEAKVFGCDSVPLLLWIDGGLAGYLPNSDFGYRPRQRFARATASSGGFVGAGLVNLKRLGHRVNERQREFRN